MITNPPSIAQHWLSAITNKEFTEALKTRCLQLAERQTDTEINIYPGEISSIIQSGRRMTYEVTLRQPPVQDSRWKKFLDLLCEQPAQLAAFYNESSTIDLAQTFADSIDTFVPPADLDIECSCPNKSDFCNHVLATIGLATELFDEDPFEYILFKGKTRKNILTYFEDNNATSYEDLESFDQLRTKAIGQMPQPLEPGKMPVPTGQWQTTPPANSPFTLEGLKTLAEDATTRAWKLLTANESSHLELSVEEDLERFQANK